MVKRRIFVFISVLLVGLLVLSGCDVTSILSKDKEPPSHGETSDNENNASESSDIIEVSFAEPIKLDNHITVTVNDAEIFSSFEETGYTADDEAVIRKDEYDSDYIFITIDYTFLYTDESLKGQIIKGDENSLSINSMFDLYSSETGTQSDNTQKRVWTRFPDTETVFDYEVVDGGERYEDSNSLYFDVIEGQDLNFKVVYAVQEELLIDSPFYLVITKIISSNSNMYPKYNLDLHLSVEDL